jgi:hypothetical protein
MPTATLVGSGRFVTEARPLSPVNRIVSSGGLGAMVILSGSDSIEITAEDNVMPLLDCVERGGTLMLGWKPNPGGVSAHGITIRVGLRELAGVNASGASTITVDGLSTPAFDLSLSGASRFNGSGFTGHTVAASISGASTATLRAVDLLTASASGASTLEFFGDPVVNAHVSDVSVVRRIGP